LTWLSIYSIIISVRGWTDKTEPPKKRTKKMKTIQRKQIYDLSKNDIINHLKIPATSQNKIKVIFCGVTKEYKHLEKPIEQSENGIKKICLQ